MLSILNNYQYGFLLVPVVIACRENGLFELLEKKISFLDLVKELKANDGHLRVALNMFESLNWVIRNKKDQYELNPQTNEYKKIPLELSELYIFPIDEYLKGDSGKYSLKKWVERSSKRWNVDDNMIAEFMDGPLVVPLLLGLIDNKMVESSISPAKTLFPKLKPDVETEIYKLFEEQGWIYSDKSSVKYTEAGRFIIDWIIISATIASYRPMLNKIDDILFGDCTAIFQRDQSGNELHFDTLQGFFHQLPTGAEGFPIAAARVGLFPNPDFFQKYPDTIACSRITLNHFERRNYSVRYATENDMPILEKLEQACWGSAMATPTTVLRKRLGQNPKGNLVIEMEGQVVGVVYSQCISAMEDLKTVSADNVHKLHDENGKIIQLLSLNILPSFQDRNLGDHLLEFILQLCTLRSEIDSVVGVTRCKDYIKHSNMTLQEYIELKNDRGMSVDGILSLHQSHGAEIVSLLRDYRSNDKENKGYGVLVKYDLSTRQKRSRMDKPVVESRRSTILRENKNRIEEFVSETIAQLLCKSKADGISMDLPLMEMGLDSADLLELGRQISYRFDIQIEPAFFFEYNTGEKIIAHLSQGSTTIPSDKNNHNATFNQAQHAEDNHTKKNDIAIIGVSCRLPGNISNIDQFWQLLKNETHIVGKIPNSRWQWPVGIDPVNKHQGIDQGGFLDSIEHFDPGFFRISPREAELMDPQQRLLLEMSWECIENAGYSAETYYSSNIGVFIGASGSDYGKLLETSSEEIEAYSSIGSSLAGIPNRISYFYDFDGPSIQIDTACSSSLVAVHEAVKSIKAGECKQALVGAVNIMCHPGTTVAYYKAGMLSKTGKCQTFDSGADGYVRGEGAVMVLLKPLKNALNDQDGIYAVIKGSAINHGGRAGGFTVPNPAKQSSLLISACKSAGISPDMLSYIEAHGTGTPLGDPVEIRGIKQSFTAQIENPETLKPRSCGLGSVKTNIGHLEAAAGLAGVFKVMLSFQHKTLPATLNFNKLNPHISLEGTPLFVVDKTQPWNVSGNQTRKFAGVSSFGSGGTNAHLILEEPPPAIERESDIKPYYLVCLSARSEKALHQRERDLTNWIAGTGKHAKIDDISTNLLFGREHFPYRSAYVVRDTDQLFEELSNVLNGKKVEHAFRETLKSKECENPVSENSGSTIISKLKSNRNIDQKTYRQQLGALAELYVKGFVIDWQSFHNNHWERSLRLPTYPFDKKVVRYTDGKNRTNESQTDKQTDSLSAKAKNKVVRNQAEKRNGVLFLKPHWELKENTRGNGLIRYEKRLLVFCEPTQTFQQELKSEIDQSEYLLLKSPNSNVGERFITYTTTLFSHIQKLVEKKYTGQILIQLVTSDEAGQNGSADSVSLFKGLSGLIKTTNLEYSKVTGQTIIIDSWGSLQQIMDLLAGCGQLPGDQQIRYHGSKRFVARWKEMDSIQQQIIEHQTLNTFNVQYRIENMKNGIYQHPWKDGATYLFTGGAGFIGLVIVEEIVRQAENITLYLTGRSSLNDEKREKLSQLEINGSRIIYKQVDVADRNAVDGLINEITLNSNAMERASGALNGSLNGILHGAGVIRANYIVNKTEEELTEVLSPKIRGTINLDEACKNLDLDFFVLFSSISSSSGVVGQADYAAANAFLDSFAEYRNRLVRENRRNGHTLSLNWPLWEKGGVRIDPENIKLMERQLGVKPMQNSTGINSLYRGVAAKVDQLMVLEGDWEKLKEKWLSNDSSFVTEASKANHYNQAPTENSHVLTEIENSLIEMASGILKISSAELDTDVILNEFGFDSITFTEFSNKINDTLKAEIDPTLFFEYPTIRDVAGYIAGRTNFSDIFPSPHVEPEMKFDTQRSTNPQRTLTEEIAKPKTDLIAIVGISGKFPGAEDIDQFWENLLAGKDSVSEIPRNRWDWREFYGYPHNCQAKWGGFIDGVDEFDPLFFEISPQEAKLMDPQQRFLMTYVWKALEDAGYSGESIRGSDMAIFAGTADLGYGRLINVENTVMEGHFITGTYPTIGPNRMSYFLDIHGPSELIDTACSSSLVAIHKAVRAIRNGDCEMAVAGGVNTLIDPIGYLGRYKAGMLSIDGRCKTFSDRADGYIPGEGVGMIVLKKLSAAEKSGDQIYGVIIGSSQNHGGRANTLTSPNPQAQARLLKTAYQSAENPIDPRTITYIETHGTGTELGDPIEINGLKSAFKDMIDDFGKAPSGFTGRTPGCGLGSVKSNIGHLELAAGIAGVIKVLLQMKHKTLVKTLHCDQVNPYIQLNQSPFYIVQKNQEWATLRDDSGKEIPRRTGISSFGFGGTNAHVVIEEYRQKQEVGYAQVSEKGKRRIPIILSAKTEESLNRRAETLLNEIDKDKFDEQDMDRIAYTLQIGRTEMEERMAIIVSSIEELKSKLSDIIAALSPIDQYFRGRVKSNEQSGEGALLSEILNDGDLTLTTDSWMRKGKFDLLLKLWVLGAKVNWKELYSGKLPQKTGLPSYPFAKEKYWFEKKGYPVKSDMIHPLLHHNTSKLGKQEFSSQFSGKEFFFADHIVNEKMVLPGMAQLEMARASVFESLDKSVHSKSILVLKHITWTKPIIASEDGKTLCISLTPKEKNEIGYRIYSPSNDHSDIDYSSGTASFVPVEASPKMHIDRLKKECNVCIIEKERFYRFFDRTGITLGSSFKGIDRLYIGKNQVLVKLTLPDSPVQGHDSYYLHPCLMDSASQGNAGLFVSADEILSNENSAVNTAVPFSLKELAIISPCQNRMWATVRFSNGSQRGDKVINTDIDISDEQGNICVRFTGYSLRVLKHAKNNAIKTVLFRPYWREVYPNRQKAVHIPTQHLICLCEPDKKTGERVRSHFDQAWVISLRSIEASVDDRYSTYSEQIFVKVGELLRSKSKDRILVQIIILNWEEQSLFNGISGLLKTAEKENPRFNGQTILINSWEDRTPVEKILEENIGLPGTSEIKYQNEKRWITDWKEIAPSASRIPWKDNSVYLITGGMGALGILFSKEILRRANGVTLVLTGRSPIDKVKEDQIRELSELSGTVVFRQIDVANRESVETLFSDLRNTLSAPIDGIIHCAGIIQDNFIIKKTAHELAEVLAPKVKGLVNLDQASKDLKLDFFILFSSFSSIVGNIGQSDYAVGNAFMDAYSKYRNRLVKDNLRTGYTVSINWPFWKDGGMSMDEAAEEAMKKSGIHALDTESGIQALYKTFSTEQEDRIAVLAGNPNQIKQLIQSNKNIQIKSPDNRVEKKIIGDDSEEALKLSDYFKKLLASQLELSENRINVDTPLEKYGVDSVIALKAISQLEKTFGTLSKTLLFEYDTIRELSDYFLKNHHEQMSEIVKTWIDGKTVRESELTGTSISPGMMTDISGPTADTTAIEETENIEFPLSKSQEGFWITQKLLPELAAYNIPLTYRVGKGFDPAVFKKACRFVFDQLPILSISVREKNGIPLQKIGTITTVPFREFKMPNSSDEEIIRFLNEEFKKPFNPETGPLMRIILVSRTESDHFVHVTFHHTLSDGNSNVLFFKRLWDAYREFSHGKTPLPISTEFEYRDFVTWEKEMLEGEEGTRHLDYWKKQLAEELPVVVLPVDHSRGTKRSFAGSTINRKIDQTLTEQIRKTVKSHRISVPVFFLEVLNVLLHRYTHLNDLIVGVPSRGQSQYRFGDVMGCYINMLPIRSRIIPRESFIVLTKKLHLTMLEGMEHGDYPVSLLIKELCTNRDAAVAPLFQVFFSYQNQLVMPSTRIVLSDDKGMKNGELQLEPLLEIQQEGDSEFGIELSELEDHMILKVKYNPELFEKSTIEKLIGHFSQLLESLSKNPEQPVATVQMLSQAEQERIRSFNISAETPNPKEESLLIHQLFEKQVEKTPESIAIKMITDESSNNADKPLEMSYGELNRRVNQLARYLKSMGIGPGKIVGVILENSFNSVVCILALFKTGAIYAPLDADSPGNRIKAILDDAEIQVLITDNKNQPHLTILLSSDLSRQLTLVNLDSESEAIRAQETKNNSIIITDESPAYLIHTSGSTGIPKGVLISHGSIAEHCLVISNYYELSEEDNILQFYPLHVDTSLEQILPGLLNGATIFLKSKAVWSAKAFFNHIEAEQLTIVDTPPSYLHELLLSRQTTRQNTLDKGLRLFIVGGETLMAKTIELFRTSSFARARLINAYGPTETTVTATIFEANDRSWETSRSRSIPIGRSLPGTKVCILDEFGNMVPEGVSGELHIGGNRVGIGYLNRDESTRERFVADPAQPGKRLYKTGDLAGYIPGSNGLIEFLGRIDRQIKIRGFRIEPGEIETQLNRHPSVKESLVLFHKTTDHEGRLTGYVIPQNEKPNSAELSKFLVEKIPKQMIPSEFIMFDEFPKNSAGKTDLKALSAVRADRNDDIASHEMPRNETESALARIWKEVLDIPEISIHDNFFEIGGHSLLFIRLTAVIEKEMKKELPISLLMEAPTIAQMARRLTLEDSDYRKSPLVLLQPYGEKTPFFCVHPVGGTVDSYMTLAAQIGKNRPFGALQSLGLINHGPETTTVEEMAKTYLTELKKKQPVGPYQIGGWSMGGVVAYEMAQQLRQAGEKQVLLVLIDSYVPKEVKEMEQLQYSKNNLKKLSSESRMLLSFISDFSTLTNIEKDFIDEEILNDSDRLFEYISEKSSQNSGSHLVDKHQLQDRYKIYRANRLAMDQYDPKPYDGKAVRFSTKIEREAGLGDSAGGWKNLIQGILKEKVISGNHYSLLKQPHVKFLAEEIKNALNEAYFIE